jgi:hypothetical protein
VNIEANGISLVPTDPIIKIAYDSASDMLKALSPNFGIVNSNPSLTIYRGHSRHDHLLLPSAFRPNTKLLSGGVWIESQTIITRGDHARAEFETVIAFLEICDREGIRLPEDSQHSREFMEEMQIDLAESLGMSSLQFIGWPPRNIWSSLALSQHYTIPTRMLDWSYSPYVAAYFAAAGAAADYANGITSPDHRLAIFIMENTSCLRMPRIEIQSWPMRMRLVDAPTCDNNNLRAQKGCFIVCQESTRDFSSPIDRTEYSNRIIDHSVAHSQPIPKFTKLTLPAREAGSLLRLLHNEGHDAATIYPGHEGVARAIFERELW